jgi:hypothetical protein
LWLFLKNRNALWLVKICHDVKVVPWLWLLVAWMPAQQQKHENLVSRTTFYRKQENRALHSGIKTSPYEAMFGTA